MPNASTIRAVIFDLDGTLLDTLEDIANSVNEALRNAGLPEHPVDAYRQFIGEGVATLLVRALPPEQTQPEAIERFVADYRQVYARHWNVRTQPYAGIPELLDALAERQVALAVLSNKPDEFTKKCVDHYLGRWPFAPVLGQRTGVPKKPDPAAALEIAGQLAAAPAEMLFVGDSATDMRTARAAGMRAVGVTWGFRPRAELEAAGADSLIDHPLELLRLL